MLGCLPLAYSCIVPSRWNFICEFSPNKLLGPNQLKCHDLWPVPMSPFLLQCTGRTCPRSSHTHCSCLHPSALRPPFQPSEKQLTCLNIVKWIFNVSTWFSNPSILHITHSEYLCSTYPRNVMSSCHQDHQTWRLIASVTRPQGPSFMDVNERH